MKDEINKSLINNLKATKENKNDEVEKESSLSNSVDNKENISVSTNTNLIKKEVKNINALRKFKKIKSVNDSIISNDSIETDISSANFFKRGNDLN